MATSKSIAKFRARLRDLMPHLEKQYRVDTVALFGSYVRAQEHPDSDLDILVTFRETPDLFTFIRLEQFLEDALGVPVDLVMRDALKPHLAACRREPTSCIRMGSW